MTTRFELEELAATLAGQLREQPFEEPIPTETAGLAEELAAAVLDYFTEADWAETMAELTARRAIGRGTR
jgi:hypothetical protein